MFYATVVIQNLTAFAATSYHFSKRSCRDGKVTSRKGVADTPEAWIYYKESGHGTPILMLHGNAQTHLVFSYYEKQLSRKYGWS